MSIELRPLDELSGIYCIENQVNGKLYIGSAENFKVRWRKHHKDLEKGIHHSPHLQRAWNQYGSGSFSFNVLEIVLDKNDLIEREQWWLYIIESYKSERGYNIYPTAGSRLGYKLSEEQKERLRIAHKGLKLNLSEERLQQLRDQAAKLPKYQQGHKQSQEIKEKIIEKKSKIWKGFVTPEGIEMPPIKNLKRFCLENNLHNGNMCDLYYGKITNHKGWTCKRVS